MQYSTTEFETLYTQCFPQCLRLAISVLHEENEARDVVQEMFLKLWESEKVIDNPRAFILRSVRNAALNRISMIDTREKIRRRLTLESAESDFDIESRSADVISAIGKVLTPRQQEVIDRIYAGGMSYKAASESLGISVSAVNKNLVTALKKLRTHFKSGKE